MRIPSGEALGPEREAKIVEIAKDVMPTIGLHLIRQPEGGSLSAPRSTINSIYAVVSGKVRFIVEDSFDETLDPGDVIAVPSWHSRKIEARLDAVLFRVSDEPLMRKLGLKRSAGQ